MKLTDTEILFMNIVWDNEPLASKELVKRCEEKFGWKKSTTYTFLKRLSEKNILENIDSTVRSIVKRAEVQKAESQNVIDISFNGSLSGFVTSFLLENRISKEEYEELIRIINANQEE